MTMLRNILAVALIAVMAAPAFALNNDVIYLSDTKDLNGTDGLSVLYRVEIDSTTMRANLTMLPNGTVPYNHVDAIAAEPDGSIIWLINSGNQPPGMQNNVLAKYEVATAAVSTIGQISGLTGDIDQAAVSPSGTLYVTNRNNNNLYTINKDTAAATLIGSTGVTATGGDIAFDTDGTLYSWVNGNGLYQLSLPAPITATKIGPAATGYTGLAVRANGFGDLIASDGHAVAGSSNIQEVSKLDASITANYPMYIGGVPWTSINSYGHGYGDMTTGPLVLCTKTIGYWKNHDWNGAVVEINGEFIDESNGRFGEATEKPWDGYLWNARGNTYSMLFAQLIAAKLNTNNALGITAIDAAEGYLASMGISLDDIYVIVPKLQKSTYSSHVNALAMFNEMYHCEDEGPMPE